MAAKTLTAAQNQAVKERWNQENNATCIWTFPPVISHFVRCAFGHEAAMRHGNNLTWAEDLFLEKYLKGMPVEHVLSICCGFGQVERIFASRLTQLKHCLGLDISPHAIERAQELAANEGFGSVLHYEVADLNTYDWPAGAYDLVIANGALHHIANLEEVLAAIRRSLKPRGCLYACECIGPNYQDHPKRHVEIINAFAFLVPPHMRRVPALKPA